MEVIITVLFFLALFGWIAIKFFPVFIAWLIKRKLKKGQVNGGFTCFGWNGGGGFTGFGGFQQHEPHEEKKQEGKVIISDIPKQEKVIDKEVGEYVDFEEK